MFGVVCSGRPIELAQQVEPTKYVIELQNAATINHLAVFLLPQTEFTDTNFTALVYFKLPQQAEFKLLGGLNPARPLAIFRLNNPGAKTATSHALDDDSMGDADPTPDQGTLSIGISIEPTVQALVLLQQLAASTQTPGTATPAATGPGASAAPRPLDVMGLANKIMRHAHNYLSGFVDAAGNVPMKTFDTWWDKFRTRLAQNPGFLDHID